MGLNQPTSAPPKRWTAATVASLALGLFVINTLSVLTGLYAHQRWVVEGGAPPAPGEKAFQGKAPGPAYVEIPASLLDFQDTKFDYPYLVGAIFNKSEYNSFRIQLRLDSFIKATNALYSSTETTMEATVPPQGVTRIRKQSSLLGPVDQEWTWNYRVLKVMAAKVEPSVSAD